jgi:hypothetical protein
LKPWGDPELFLSFISFGGQSIEIRRYSLIELRIRSLSATFHTVWRVVRHHFFLPIVTSHATYSNRQSSDLREHRVYPPLRSLDTFRCLAEPSQREVRSFVLPLAIRIHAGLRNPPIRDRELSPINLPLHQIVSR